MLNREELIEQLQNDVDSLKDKAENTKAYNLKVSVIKKLIKSGIAIDYALPFILSSIILFNINKTNGMTPFIDEKQVVASIETMKTSSGMEKTKTSYDYDYDENTFKHSTAWKLNESGLYERVITTYEYEDLEKYDKEAILSMKKEEIEKLVRVINVEKIQKNKLVDGDSIYNEDMMIITEVGNDENNYKIMKESVLDNIPDISLYILEILATGGITTLLISRKVAKKLKEKDESYKIIDDSVACDLKEILTIRQENLELLLGNEESSDSNKILQKKLR